MNRTTCFVAGIVGVSGVFGLFLGSTPAFAFSCPDKVDVTTLGPDWKDIEASCVSLMDTMDATEIKQRATNICCKNAIEYLQKNPTPCSDKAKVRYRIKLGLTVCDTLKDPIFDYQHDYCVDQMLYHIFDPRVLKISDKCSPTGGHAAHGRGKKGSQGQAQAEASKPTAAPSPQSSGKIGNSSLGVGLQNPEDLRMDDEAYTKCQRTRLDRYLEQLKEEIAKNPSEEAACSKTKK